MQLSREISIQAHKPMGEHLRLKSWESISIVTVELKSGGPAPILFFLPYAS